MSEPKLVIEGKEYPFPTIDSITFAEGLVLEQEFGVDTAKLEKGAGGFSVAAGLAWVAKHRVDPSVKPVDMMNVTFGDIDMQADDEEDDVELPPSDAAQAAESKPDAGPGLAMIHAAGGGQAS